VNGEFGFVLMYQLWVLILDFGDIVFWKYTKIQSEYLKIFGASARVQNQLTLIHNSSFTIHN